MRYETEANLGTGLTASDVVNRFSERDLADILFKYGEERFARKIAKEITHFREKEKNYFEQTACRYCCQSMSAQRLF